MNIKQEVLEAQNRIRNHIRQTPLEYSHYLSQLGEGNIFLKCENLQITGSFKLRGAMNKLLSLSEEERKAGVVTASSGNHGVALAYALNKFGCKAIIYLPEDASPVKIEALKRYEVEIQFHGRDCVKTEEFAKKEAARKGCTYIPPYNDPKIIGGQGTIAVELLEQLPEIDAILVPVGGGGLASGIAGFLKSTDPKIAIVGCQPENSAVMYESVKAGKILDLESKPTLSDGSAGGIEQGAVTFEICKNLVDDFILIAEDEIKNAIKLLIEHHHMLVEGAGALSVAAFLKRKERFPTKNVVLVLSGAKIGLEQLQEIL